MIFLIYSSSSTYDMTESDLMDILTKSRANNTRLGISGLLLYHDGNFLQVLEGDEEAVASIFQKIQADPRHKQVSAIIKRPITKREFGDWKMGYVNLGTINSNKLLGYSDILNKPMNQETFNDDPSYAQIFIDTFREFIR